VDIVEDILHCLLSVRCYYIFVISALVSVYRDHSKSPRRSTHGQTDAEGRPVASVDELSIVGHSEEADLTSVFEKTGEQ
jgi:hypothetical protein